ncbi:visual pigment-like receptor peropsin [Plutella xylostella]|uniref:visual pigment-like receptor peropsin n=1 Tax=Plutella xylostella TaxID=51655 RepID=UPI0020326CD2|nr:visual pigment-like receptor peropsin [Plutella xylostella]
MQTVYDYYEDDCPWYYFDSSYKTLLGGCLIVFGTFGVLLNGWLFATFIHSHLLTLRSHILVLNLCTASLARNLLAFPFASSSALAKRWLFGSSCCQLYAFVNQFIGVFQMVALVVISLERYFQVKGFKYEQEMSLFFHWLLVGVCWAAAVVLATPPLFGYGVYSCDVTSTVCTFLWPSLLSGAKQLGFSILLLILGGLLPIFIIFYFIIRTIPLEKRYYKGEQQKDFRSLTKTLHGVCVTTLVLWLPSAVLAAWQWAPLLVYGYRLHVPPALAVVAPAAAEAATSVPVLCYLLGNERLRAALLGRMRKHYALLRPDKAKRFHRA